DTPVRGKLLAPVWDTAGEERENPMARYNALLKDYARAEGIYRKVAKAAAKGELPAQALHPEEQFEAAHKAELLNDEEITFMREYEKNVLEMLTVDDFPFDALAMDKSTLIDHNPA
ncbi:MAG: acyl-CoA dehydrogenase domain-containing protein, partial [Marinobacter sp.]